jgi:hypothetical protein
MPWEHGEVDLLELKRREIFSLLVFAQDMEMSVADSREMIVQKFRINRSRVLQIEREGLERLWLPLRQDGPRHFSSSGL